MKYAGEFIPAQPAGRHPGDAVLGDEPPLSPTHGHCRVLVLGLGNDILTDDAAIMNNDAGRRLA